MPKLTNAPSAIRPARPSVRGAGPREEDPRTRPRPGEMGFRLAEGGGGSGRQRPHETDSFVELPEPRARQAEISRAAVPRAEPEHRPPRGEQVERGDGRRRDRGVARGQVGDAERDPGLPGLAGDDGGRDPGVHRVARRIGDADHVVAPAVRRLRHALDQFGRVGPEEKTDFHVLVPCRVRPPGSAGVARRRGAGSCRAPRPGCVRRYPW